MQTSILTRECESSTLWYLYTDDHRSHSSRTSSSTLTLNMDTPAKVPITAHTSKHRHLILHIYLQHFATTQFTKFRPLASIQYFNHKHHFQTPRTKHSYTNYEKTNRIHFANETEVAFKNFKKYRNNSHIANSQKVKCINHVSFCLNTSEVQTE